MAEGETKVRTFEEERPVKGAVRRRGLGWRILAVVLLILLAGGAAFLLYNGSLYEAAIRALKAENESREQRIQELTADNAAKDALILSLGEESAEKDGRILELSGEAEDKDRQILELSSENGEKNGRVAALTAELAAASAPLDYQAALWETVPAAALQALKLPAELEQSEEMKRSLLTPLLQTACLEKDADNSREDRLCFLIRAADGQLLGSVSFEPAEADQAGTPSWRIAEERFDFTDCFRTATATVPPDYRVYLGEQLLGPEWIREEGIPYAAFSACYEDLEGLPTLVRYETPPFLGEPALRVLNETGRELPAEDLREAVFLDRCSKEAREKIEAFLPEFVELFLRFSADIKESARQYYGPLKLLVLPDSPLANRLRDAFEGLGYSAARAVELKSVTVNSITDLGGGRYAVDLNYLSIVTGHSSAFPPVEDELHLLLILTEEQDGKLLAEAMYYL